MPLYFHPAVHFELRGIRDWYAERNPALSTSLSTDIEAALSRIEKFPQLYARVHEFRRLQLERFPCHLYYHIRASGDVRILGAAHAHADPTNTLQRFRDRL